MKKKPMMSQSQKTGRQPGTEAAIELLDGIFFVHFFAAPTLCNCLMTSSRGPSATTLP